MRLIDLPSTGTFRLSLLFVSLFGLAALLVFGLLYFETQHFIVANIDSWLERESPNIFQSPSNVVKADFARRADKTRGSQQMFSLYDSKGRLLGGSHVPLPAAIPVFDVPFTFSAAIAPVSVRYRAIAHRYVGHEIALIGQDLHETSEFDEAFVRTVLVGGGLTVMLGVLGAALVGAGTVRQMDAIARAIQKIVKGDLSSRLPMHGRASDINRLTEVVNGMLDDIERLMHDVKSVSDGIAHDLRTPLTRILAGLERAQRRATQAVEYNAVVDEAIVELRAVLATFSALLRIAELEDAARRAGFGDSDLIEIARDVTDLYEPLAEDKNIALTFRAIGTAPFKLRGDSSLIFDALSNLVDNAIKFTPLGGRVVIEAGREHDVLLLRVRDSGCGTTEQERERIFQRFYRTDQSRHAPGNGLGLALVKAIADLHEMQICVSDEQPGLCIALRARIS